MSIPDSKSERIIVRTGSRLHFGLFSSPAPQERFFRGAGIMIDSPGFEVHAEVIDSDHDEIKDVIDVESLERIRKVIDRFREITKNNSFWKVELSSSIPLHNGLGGGTQLALAAAFALGMLSKNQVESPENLALLAGRGKRSSIGTFGFFHGGFLIDDGKSSPDDFGQCEIQRRFPENWQILLVTPKEQNGLAGSAEVEAFKKLPPIDAKTAQKLYGLMYHEMLHAVENSNLEQFQNSVHQFGQIVGEQFSSVQHGVYATAFAQELAEAMMVIGVGGVGQTSWGPTLFGFFDSSEKESILKKVNTIPRIDQCTVRTCHPKNSGLDYTFE